MSKKHLDYDDRLEQQYKRLGTRNPRCRCCGEANPFCLQLHHIAGRGHHGDVEIVCANCHLKLSDKQRDHVPPGSAEPVGPLARIGHYLHGLADFLAMVAETLREFAAWLIEAARCAVTP